MQGGHDLSRAVGSTSGLFRKDREIMFCRWALVQGMHRLLLQALKLHPRPVWVGQAGPVCTAMQRILCCQGPSCHHRKSKAEYSGDTEGGEGWSVPVQKPSVQDQLWRMPGPA